jgi:hypothetical protein
MPRVDARVNQTKQVLEMRYQESLSRDHIFVITVLTTGERVREILPLMSVPGSDTRGGEVTIGWEPRHSHIFNGMWSADMLRFRVGCRMRSPTDPHTPGRKVTFAHKPYLYSFIIRERTLELVASFSHALTSHLSIRNGTQRFRRGKAWLKASDWDLSG